MYFLLAKSVIAAKENNNHRDYSQSRPHVSKLYRPGVDADIFSLFLNIRLVYLRYSFYLFSPYSYRCRMGSHVGVSGHTLVCLAARWCDSVACRCGRLHVGVGRARGCGRPCTWHEVRANCLHRAHGSRDLDHSHFICHLLFLLMVLSTQDRRFWVYGHLLFCGLCCIHRVRD